MNIELSLNFTGTPDTEDVRAAKYAISLENVLRAERGQQPLPSATGAELKASYLGLLVQESVAAHKAWIERSVTNVQQEMSNEQRLAIFAKIRDRLNNGEALDTIIADITA